MIRRDGEVCLRCGRTKAIHTSHIYPKGKYRKMAYDLNNVIPLDFHCHIHWWHSHPLESGEWIKTAIPKERLEYLEQKARTIDKTKLDFETIKTTLQESENGI
jgi:5-methylcytosine-specific restriction endonuclease McrA